MTTTRLPEFSVAGYADLLHALNAAGYRFRPLEAMSEPLTSVAFLLHDVDIHIHGIERIGRLEADAGACATYCVALTQPYNPARSRNSAVLRELVELGHRIGLHYDLTTYPVGHDAGREHLFEEIRWLEDLVQSPVETISMHKPRDGLPDLFAADPPPGLLNPRSARFAVGYISDSCRAWRDDALLECLRTPEKANLLLNTHPELWLGSPADDRHAFLEGTLLQAATADARRLLLEEVQPSWARHPAARQHDARRRAHPSTA